MADDARARQALLYPQVEYVLLAEFDIDEGSTVKHQYPAPTGTDEQCVLIFKLRHQRVSP